jgi:hypothetical protein
MSRSKKTEREGLHIASANRLPRRLGPDATLTEIIKAVNELAIETQLCRLSIQDVGTKLGELSEHIRDALFTGAPDETKET